MTAVALVYFGALLLAFCAFGVYWDWRLYNRLSKSDRLVHRNLQRIGGRQS